ncbi:hypothetical protein FQA39_LY13841 [Lamprigera yunnana]|nr:hypothetical protein FQA39_LY13841 [Lamprigera yunnana]
MFNFTKPKLIFCSKKVLSKIQEIKNKVSYMEKIIVLDREDDTEYAESFNNFISRRSDVDLDLDNFETANYDRNEHIAVILQSSGTTGLPKGVMLTDTNILTKFIHSRNPLYGTGLHAKPGVSFVNFLPFFHVYGYCTILTYLTFGFHVVQLQVYKEELFLRSIEKYKAQSISVVPRIMIFLMKSPLIDKYDLTSLMEILCGADCLSNEVFTSVKNRLNLKYVRQGYGLTETTSVCCITPLHSTKYDAIGKVFPCTLAKIVDVDTNAALGQNEQGELCFKGDIVMKGYFKNEEATKNAVDKDGWLHTGDIAYYDEDEHLYIVDRLKELIKYKGFQVAPAELEAILIEHPNIKEVAVVGKPDLEAGELPTAFVVETPGKTITEQEVHKFVAVRAFGNPTVESTTGPVQGRYMTSYGGRIVAAFEGIPYAMPPVGALRFEEPKPVKPWTDTIVANTTYVCMQFIPIVMTSGIMGTEDCLYLYIYVPKENITGDENWNVIVHIHGGAFMLGAPKYMASPAYITDKDVVYVSFNYRVGIFGFLSTEDETVPGNNGLKDQVMALKWIQANIKSFGGNPNSVTLTGLSAGGASVHYHYLSPMSKGLFHRGFSQSGTALNTWALTENPLEKTLKLAALVNCSSQTMKVMISCLKEKPHEDILTALKQFFIFINAIPFTPFGPVIEKGSTAFLPDHPYNLLRNGKINDYPWITSNTKNEGIYPVGFFILYRKLEEINERWDEIMPCALDYNDTASERDKIAIAQKIRKRYFKNESVTFNNTNKLIDLFTDRAFLTDAETAIRLHARISKSPVYYYRFNYKLKMKTFFSTHISGVAHSDDGRLLFPIIGNPEFLLEDDANMKDVFVNFVNNFAIRNIPDMNNVQWIPLEKEKLKINQLLVNSPTDIHMDTTEELTDTKFWKELNLQENGNILKSK